MNEQEQQELIKKYGILIGYLKGLRRYCDAQSLLQTSNDITRQLEELGED